MLENKIIFVADFFAKELTGGAELTSQALIDVSPFKIICAKSSEITFDYIDKHKDCYWIFTNTQYLAHRFYINISKLLKYSVIEYDYRYCIYRSPELHKSHAGCECDCYDGDKKAFLHNADRIFYMSIKQRDWNIKHVGMDINKTTTISSIFSDEDIDYLIKLSKNWKFGGWAVIHSDSIIKGFEETIHYCKNKKLHYEVFKKLPYKILLEKLSHCKGLVFHPKGMDTCPRIVIEAKLMGLELDINDYVGQRHEEWFNFPNALIIETLKQNRKIFWEELSANVFKKILV